MISHLSGTLSKRDTDHVVVDVGGVGYEVLLPYFVMRTLQEQTVDQNGDQHRVNFQIYYHVTERQIRPTLIGFNNEHEKRFFEKFISVEDIGPLKAARALIFSVSTIAQAIEGEDFTLLRRLPGIGDRTSRKIVASLKGKVAEEALLRDEGFRSIPETADSIPTPKSRLREDVIDVLVSLGHRRSEAGVKVDAAMTRNPGVDAPEELIREVYRLVRADEGTA